MSTTHVTDLAINRAMGMQLAPHGSDHIVTLPASPGGALLLNHVGSVHASVQFALAEAGSGELLLQHLGAAQDQVFVVLRTSSVKFRKPAPPHGELRAAARFLDTDPETLSAELESRGRALVAVLVEVTDTQGVVTMTGQFDWFLQRQTGEV
jgi:acyl-coenzyme A thioesterase PaaI-like protein